MTLRRHRLFAAGLAILAVAGQIVFASSALAQDEESRSDITLQNQILELRHDVDTLRDQVASGAGAAPSPQPQAPPDSVAAGAAPSGDALTNLLNRVSQLDDQMRTLQGQQDEANNRLQQQNADLTKQIGDLSFRVQALEGKNGSSAPGGPSPPDAANVPPPSRVSAAIAPAPAHATLPQGYAALARRDYPTAEAVARETLANPRSTHANDAQFLLAQSLAGQHSYQQAALAYDDTYTKSRRGPHAEDALLGLAGSLAALGARPASCATLDKLRSEFPAARGDVRASADAIGRRAACH